MKSLHIDYETHKIYIEYDIKDLAKSLALRLTCKI